MGNQTKRNYVSGKVTADTGSWTELTGPFESYFSIYTEAELLLSIGHATPVEATAVTVPALGAFRLPTGVLGPIHVLAVGAAGDVHVVGA
jgi:hypothetical protein